ncbi:MAG: protein kinase [Elusimicrobia bacterium]|nr:protein kinase [Elusimicrobiota bacterium]
MSRRLLVAAALLWPTGLAAAAAEKRPDCIYTVEEKDPATGEAHDVDRPGLCGEEKLPYKRMRRMTAWEEKLFGAIQAAQRGDPQAAVKAATESLAERPTPPAYLIRSMVYNGTGRYKEALQDADSGLALQPGDPELLKSRAAALRNLERLKQDFEPAKAPAPLMPPSGSEPAPAEKEKPGGGSPGPLIVVLGAALGLGLVIGARLSSRRAKSAPRSADQTPTLLQTSRPPQAGAPAGIATQAPLSVPLLRGRYELKGRIGSGGMGIVYEGYDHSLGRRVAIKQMRSEIKDDAQQREVFLREAKIISHLSHPYIVAIYEAVQEGGEIYLVFDYVDGKPLSQILLEKKRLSLPECQRIFTYVCEAISCAHRSRILHRDLKPSNIMVDKDGYAKVMDFGIAREAKESLTRLTHADASGTPAYMAPEQHLGRGGRASDIYALGVCLYEAMTGSLPFPGPDFLAQKERMKYPPPQFLAPDLPKEAELLFAVTLALDPKLRVGDAAELLDSLKSLRS